MNDGLNYLTLNAPLTVERGPGPEDDVDVTIGSPTGQIVARIDPLHEWPAEYRPTFAKVLAQAPTMLAALRWLVSIHGDRAFKEDHIAHGPNPDYCGYCEVRGVLRAVSR
jgi:hypothetical protein